MDTALPPFDDWATISISDSESEDEQNQALKTLEEEVRDREVAALSAELERTADRLVPSVEGVPVPVVEAKGEHKDLIEALRRFAPAMEEEVELYQEYATMKHIGERLRN